MKRSIPLALAATAVLLAMSAGTASATPNCADPTISGTERVGRTLTANQAGCNGLGQHYSFAWARCDTATGGGCGGVGTGSTHVLTSSDLGNYIRLRRTATDLVPPAQVTDVFTGRVRGRPPSASFTATPGLPVAGDEVTFTSTSTDPDGDAISYAWDLDGDGAFDDGNTKVVHFTYARGGAYTATLRVTADGETSTVFRTVEVDPKSTARRRLLRPFPRVAIGGFIVGRGVRLTLLSVRAPRGSLVRVRCRGRGCPRRTTRARVGRRRVKTFRSFRRRFRAGTVIAVYV